MCLMMSNPNFVCSSNEMLVNVQSERGNYCLIRILLVVVECI